MALYEELVGDKIFLTLASFDTKLALTVSYDAFLYSNSRSCGVQKSTRPSHKELTGKLKQALKATENQLSIPIVEPKSFAIDAIELGYSIKEDLRDVLKTILKEIKPEHYAGNRPPERSYKDNIHNAELFAFKWFSTKFDQEVYFKFTFDKSETMWLVSLHEDR